MTNRIALLLALLATFALTVVIAVLTLTPSVGVPKFNLGDKAYHAIAFAALAFPLAFARPRWWLWSVLGAVAYGGLIEVVQPYFGRSMEMADWIADWIGALSGATVGAGLRSLLSFRRVQRSS